MKLKNAELWELLFENFVEHNVPLMSQIIYLWVNYLVVEYTFQLLAELQMLEEKRTPPRLP